VITRESKADNLEPYDLHHTSYLDDENIDEELQDSIDWHVGAAALTAIGHR